MFKKPLKNILDNLFTGLAGSVNKGVKKLELPTVKTENGIDPKTMKYGAIGLGVIALLTIFSINSKTRRGR